MTNLLRLPWPSRRCIAWPLCGHATATPRHGYLPARSMLWPHPRSTRAAGRYYPVRAVFEELAVSRQREGNVVVSRPFRHLTHVAARDHQVATKLCRRPRNVICGSPARPRAGPLTRRLKQRPRPSASARSSKTSASESASTKTAKCASNWRITARATRARLATTAWAEGADSRSRIAGTPSSTVCR